MTKARVRTRRYLLTVDIIEIILCLVYLNFKMKKNNVHRRKFVDFLYLFCAKTLIS